MEFPSEHYELSKEKAAKTPDLHVAVIMDGNGRWAQQRGYPRPVGHRKGAERVREIVKNLPRLGITHFTIYAFSTENWKRSNQEVLALLALFERYIRREAEELNRSSVRVRFLGDRTRLSAKLQNLMGGLEALTCRNSLVSLNIAVNYGGRDEIVRGAKALLEAVQAGKLSLESMNEDSFASCLDLAGQPYPDLVIRTGGQLRISNFLLWHAAYSEYVFADTLWPDFSVQELEAILGEYRKRTRNFGAV